MNKSLNKEKLEKIQKIHEGSLNHWVGGLMHTTVQTRYGLQYMAMRLSGYTNALTETDFLAIKHGM